MSDSSQGEGWWVASDGKWYAPEQHPDYVAPVAQSPVTPATPSDVAETVAIPAATSPVTVSHPGPSFTPASATTASYPATVSTDPNYNLPETTASSSKSRSLLLGVGALVLVVGLGFLAFRFFTSSGAGGADSPEAAVGQLIASINERDPVGFVDVFDPDEINAWFGSFAPAVQNFEQLDDEGASRNEISDAYVSLFKSFDYTLTGPAGADVSFQVEPLDDDGRISRVRVNGLDFQVNIDALDTAVIVASGGEPDAIDLSKANGARAELRDEPGGLAARLFAPGEETIDEFTRDAHIDLVTVKKNGKWYVSMGYTFLEVARNQGEFDQFGRPDFGRAFDLVETKTGGADSPEAVVQQLFTSIETLDYETIITITDPYATPYLHDYQPLIDSQVDEADRQQAIRDASLRFGALELSISEWEGRTLVTTADISASADGGSIVIDTMAWCVTVLDEFGRDRVCLEDGIAELLDEIDSDINPRDFIPEQSGFIVIERNGRWYLDALGTLGFYADQIAEAAVLITDELDGSPANEFGNLFVVEGPIVRQNAPAVVQAESGAAGVALDLSGYPVISSGFGEFNVAVARVATSEAGSFVAYDDVPLAAEDWFIAYDADPTDAELPAIGANTSGSLDVELFEVQVTEVGVDGFTGQLGGQGRPQIFVVSPEASGVDIFIEGASAETVYGWQSRGVVLNRDDGGFFIGDGAFTVVSGEPGATFTISVNLIEEAEAEPEPELEPERVPEPSPEPEPLPGLDDPTADAFALLVEPEGYLYGESQPGGYFDGCGGPNDPDVESFVFEHSDGSLLVVTPYPSAARAEAAFDSLLNVNSPCDSFTDIETNETLAVGDDVRIEWQFIDEPESVTYEQYRLVGDTIVVAANLSLIDLDDQLAILANW